MTLSLEQLSARMRQGEDIPLSDTARIALALYVLARKVKSGDLSQVEVSYAVEGRGGPAPVKISRERMPLSDFFVHLGNRIVLF